MRVVLASRGRKSSRLYGVMRGLRTGSDRGRTCLKCAGREPCKEPIGLVEHREGLKTGHKRQHFGG
jgi:hypothetical protein